MKDEVIIMIAIDDLKHLKEGVGKVNESQRFWKGFGIWESITGKGPINDFANNVPGITTVEDAAKRKALVMAVCDFYNAKVEAGHDNAPQEDDKLLISKLDASVSKAVAVAEKAVTTAETAFANLAKDASPEDKKNKQESLDDAKKALADMANEIKMDDLLRDVIKAAKQDDKAAFNKAVKAYVDHVTKDSTDLLPGIGNEGTEELFKNFKDDKAFTWKDGEILTFLGASKNKDDEGEKVAFEYDRSCDYFDVAQKLLKSHLTAENDKFSDYDFVVNTAAARAISALNKIVTAAKQEVKNAKKALVQNYRDHLAKGAMLSLTRLTYYFNYYFGSPAYKAAENSAGNTFQENLKQAEDKLSEAENHLNAIKSAKGFRSGYYVTKEFQTAVNASGNGNIMTKVVNLTPKEKPGLRAAIKAWWNTPDPKSKASAAFAKPKSSGGDNTGSFKKVKAAIASAAHTVVNKVKDGAEAAKRRIVGADGDKPLEVNTTDKHKPASSTEVKKDELAPPPEVKAEGRRAADLALAERQEGVLENDASSGLGLD